MRLRSKALSIIVLFSLLLIGTFAFSSTLMAAEVEQRSGFVSPIMVVNTSFLNVRTGPGAHYSVLVTVVGGTELPVLGVARDRVWYQVSTVAGVGWINSQFAIPRGNFFDVPFVAPPEITDDVADPTSDDSISGVAFGAGREWGLSIINTHPARTAPTISATSPGTAGADTSVIYNLIEATSAEGIVWYRVSIPSLGSVWVEGPKTLLRPFACPDDGFSAVSMLGDVSPTRGPDGSGTLDGNLRVPIGAEAYLLDYQAGQYKVELIDGNTGWIPDTAASVRQRNTVHSQYCQLGGARRTARVVDGTAPADPLTPRLTSPRAIINTGFLNIRSGPGAQYTVVTTLAGGTELAVLGFAPDGVWYLIEGTFGQGWLNREFVIFRGDGSRLPVIREARGATIARPTAEITNAVTLYAAPNITLGSVGALSGPLEVPVVARTADSNWVQLSTTLGFGWVRANEVTLRGDTALLPVVGN